MTTCFALPTGTAPVASDEPAPSTLLLQNGAVTQQDSSLSVGSNQDASVASTPRSGTSAAAAVPIAFSLEVEGRSGAYTSANQRQRHSTSSTSRRMPALAQTSLLQPSQVHSLGIEPPAGSRRTEIKVFLSQYLSSHRTF